MAIFVLGDATLSSHYIVDSDYSCHNDM